MTDTDRLRELLDQAAPTHADLDPTTRATAVARRGRSARRRDLTLVGVVAVAVVALPIAVPLAVGRGDRPVPEPSSVGVGNPTKACPTSPMDAQDLGVVPSALGKVDVARSCPVNGQADPPLPAEPLLGTGAQAFADDVTALPAYKLPSFCMVANVMQQPWALQLQKADGELVTIGSTMRVCAAVRVDGVDRGVDQVVAAFEGNLARQQSGIPELGCPTGGRLADGAATWNASFDPATATAGILCYRGDPMGGKEYVETEGTLGTHELATILDDLASGLRQQSDGGMCTDTGPQRLLVLQNADGDQAAYVDDDCTGEFASSLGYWNPSTASEKAIDATLGRANPL